MLVRTWGFVPTRPEHPWVQLEARAEAGAVLRASGTSYAALMACLARVRSGIKQAGCPWPGKALTLHFHPACRPEDLPHLDVPVALLMLAIQGQLPAEGLSEWASTGSLDLAGNLHLPHKAGLSQLRLFLPKHQPHRKSWSLLPRLTGWQKPMPCPNWMVPFTVSRTFCR